jgi:hypothetical protein
MLRSTSCRAGGLDQLRDAVEVDLAIQALAVVDVVAEDSKWRSGGGVGCDSGQGRGKQPGKRQD